MSGRWTPTIFPLAGFVECPAQQIADAESRCVLPRVLSIQSLALHTNDGNYISPLAVRAAAAKLIPPELLKQDVFWRMHEQFAPVLERDALAPRKLLRIERRAARDEQVDLQHRPLMNQVCARACSNGTAQRIFIRVEVRAQA